MIYYVPYAKFGPLNHFDSILNETVKKWKKILDARATYWSCQSYRLWCQMEFAFNRLSKENESLFEKHTCVFCLHIQISLCFTLLFLQSFFWTSPYLKFYTVSQKTSPTFLTVTIILSDFDRSVSHLLNVCFCTTYRKADRAKCVEINRKPEKTSPTLSIVT